MRSSGQFDGTTFEFELTYSDNAEAKTNGKLPLEIGERKESVLKRKAVHASKVINGKNNGEKASRS